jgi:hypothetical protein
LKPNVLVVVSMLLLLLLLLAAITAADVGGDGGDRHARGTSAAPPARVAGDRSVCSSRRPPVAAEQLVAPLPLLHLEGLAGCCQ